MDTVRSAASVSAVLRRAGFTTGIKYTQFGFEKDGQKITSPAVQVTRQARRNRFETQDAGEVRVFCVDPGQVENLEFASEVENSLLAAGLPAVRHPNSANISIPDDRPNLPKQQPVTIPAADVLRLRNLYADYLVAAEAKVLKANLLSAEIAEQVARLLGL